MESGDFFVGVVFKSASFGAFFDDFLGCVGRSFWSDFRGPRDEDGCGCGAKLAGPELEEAIVEGWG